MVATTDGIGYGIRQVNIKNLLATGAADASASEYIIDNPQRMAMTFVYINGEQVVLRGGDDIVALIQDDDKFVGVDISLELAELMPEVDETICGGSATPASSQWESPQDDTEAAFPFEMEVWVANYDESDSESSQDGFIKYTFPLCKGRRDSGEHADKAFGTQIYSIRARKNSSNPSAIASAIKYEKVASIV